MTKKYEFNNTAVVLGTVGFTGFPKDSVNVTRTETLRQGSLLKADGTEATKAEASLVVGVVDDVNLSNILRGVDYSELVPVGEDILITVAKRYCIFNTAACFYKDGSPLDEDGKAALRRAGNTFSTIANEEDFF